MSNPAPGWYPDPTGAVGQRYWDGHNWVVGSPTPPKAKHKKWPWIVGVVVALIVVASIAGGKDDKKTTASAPAGAPLTAAVDAPAAEMASQGSEVRDGKFAFVVTNVENGHSVAGDMSNQFMQKSAQGQWTLVHMTVTNTSDKPQTFYAGNQKLKAGGNTFDSDGVVAMYLHSMSVDINPGNKIQATVAFDVPPGTSPEILEVHDSAFSNGAQIKLG